MDKVSLKFSPIYSKLQFELENAIKRYQRLDGEDHFATDEPRPQRLEPNGEISPEDLNAESLPKQCSLRIDDIDIYQRIVGYEEKCNRSAEKFINRTKWVPMAHRFDVFTQTQEYFQEHRLESIDRQKAYADRLEQKATYLIEYRKMGDRGQVELA